MRRIPIALLCGGIALATSLLHAHLSAPPRGTAGVPGRANCATAGCHDEFPLNSGPGRIWIDRPPQLPRDTLRLRVSMPGTPGLRWGFESIALQGYYDSMFGVILLDTLRTQLLPAGDSTPYVAHTALGTLPAVPDSGISWAFNLVVGPPFNDACGWLFVSAVAADGDGTPRGDYVYTTAEEVAIDVYCDCFLYTGDVNSSGSITSADIIGLINYVFKSGAHPEPCAEVGDVNCSTRVDAADIITLVNFVFKGGYPPCDVCSCVTCAWLCS